MSAQMVEVSLLGVGTVLRPIFSLRQYKAGGGAHLLLTLESERRLRIIQELENHRTVCFPRWKSMKLSACVLDL